MAMVALFGGNHPYADSSMSGETACLGTHVMLSSERRLLTGVCGG